MDNLLLRIPVIAGACLLNDLVYYGLHRLFGQPPSGDILVTASYSLIGTTIAGTLVYLLLQSFSGRKGQTQKARHICAAAANQTAKSDTIE